MEREIKTISFGSACRSRLGMYLSADQSEALHLGLREIYVNALDAFTETNQKNCQLSIIIDSKKRTVQVIDNGPGIPNKIREDGLQSCVAAYTLSHTGSHFDNRATNAIGLNGVGGSVVNHTASEFMITSDDGKTCVIAYFKGTDSGAEIVNVTSSPSKGKTGVIIIYTPDNKIYGNEWFNKELLIEQLDEMMKFYPNCKLTLNFDGDVQTIYYPDGLRSKKTSIYYESDSLIIALGVESGEIKPFGNRLYLPDGGNFFTHFKTQLTKTVNDISGLKLNGSQIQNVFSGYVAIFVGNPLFSNQSKTALANKEVNPEITQAVKQGIEDFSKTAEWDKVIKKLEAEMKAEAAAEKARQKVLSAKKDFQNKKINTMSDKFIDADSKNRNDCDLYLAEGDSAGGPIKRTKPNNAAVMLLRGKVLNVAKENFDKVVENNELMMIAKGLGATITDNGFLITDKSLRFGKIILAADSDEDGAHICSLLMTYFYTYFPSLIKKGMLYSLAPKLFKLEYKNEELFFGTEKELQDFIKTNKVRNAKVSRFKGLGSFDDNEFRSQIDPKTRDLIQIRIDDAKKAAEAMKLMESDVSSRKELLLGDWEVEE